MILAADIGGTKSLLALFEGAAPAFELRLASAEFADFESLLARFLDEARTAFGATPAIEAACLGVAGPVRGGIVRVTNLPWTIDAARLAGRFALGSLELMNDFAAAAWGVGALASQDLVTLQAGAPLAGAPRAVLGAGTGFGVAYVVNGVPVPGEGGHGGFAPAGVEQEALWRFLHERLGRVQVEDVVSGPGLARIHEFMTGERVAPEDAAPAALDLFVTCFGAAAGDHALNVMARGGVYVCGGIASKVLPRLAAGGFLAAFNDKGAFAEHTRRMPVHVVTNERVALLGAAAAAARGG
ncbi:MAG TPA: glucokinase [Burkholderiales bacterium]|nr:glucokinase [Burkholderiales bacterium]